ncbi:transmission-blocking target antigen P230 [Plasmodium ovale wallikeri]|uniref:6-cysteine protein, putative n=2 Tax=Plasmodium ovale TaxID=36330 RepID=A0A1C3KN12_PLAOA|nr:transmission-blocking target antigen P230 [Plasmodium ovale wallikeri]SBT75421.1 6-cysteine protein, putative [Plasmodium ovale]
MVKRLVIYFFLFLLKQFCVYGEEHICDFTKEKYLLGKNEKEYCIVNAKPFDSITFMCPKKLGAECFQNVNTVDDVREEKMESSKISIDGILYGSTLYGDTLLISPTVKQQTTFYCFCNLQMKNVKKYLKKKKLIKQKEKENTKRQSVNVGDGDNDEEVLVKEDVPLDESLLRALYKVKKYKNIIESEKKKDDNDDAENKNSSKEEEVEEELVEEEVTDENEDNENMEQVITKYGIMKVVVSTRNAITKGCDFGNNVTNYFSVPYPVERYGGSKVCRVEAKPGEFVGFKCIFDNTATVEPNNCFDHVFYEANEIELRTIMPGYTSYGNKRKGLYAYYLKLPHFIQHDYTIRCMCRSTVSQYDNYVFELAVEGGESETIAKSFPE